MLIALYVRSQAHDTASSYFENVALVRQLKQLDARWELDVMKSKMGINANYDALVDPLADLTLLQDQLRARLIGEHHEAALQLSSAETALSTTIQQKIRLIERFKSHNAVLHNSLAFLPTAAEDLRKAHSSGRTDVGGGGTIAQAALLSALLYSQAPSSEAATELERQLALLPNASKAQSAAAKENISIFASHVRTVLREQPLVNGLLRNISALPTTTRIEDLDRILSQEQKTTVQRALQDRQYLLIFAAALVALFLYAAVKLLRSHATINRVNRDLHDANTGLELRVDERTGELRTANAALTAAQAAVCSLLDNAEQGFLTITEDLVIGDQSSAACVAILGETPGGKPIVELLCREMPQDSTVAMRATLLSAFRNSSDYVRELKLGLLPAAFSLNGKYIKANYKALITSGQLMLILTDVTETKRLAEEVERERLRLEKVVLALTESEAFFSLVDDYRDFLNEQLPLLLKRIAAPGGLGELYRCLHTYKGLLAQFSFHRSPHCLHAWETRLSERDDWGPEAACAAFAPEVPLAELKADLESIGEILGQDLAAAESRLALSQDQMRAMKQTATDVLEAEGASLSPPIRRLLQTLAGLGGLNLKSALTLHGRGAVALAGRLEKRLAPVQVQGDDLNLPTDSYGAFLRSLVHVFRNAADHGIELPEVRELAGKALEGVICCTVTGHGDVLEITIADDGRGVDRHLLEDKLIVMGLVRQRVQNMPLEELMFREGLSSRDRADDVSGRGIGLAAVKSELNRLGGTVTVETAPNSGTRFCFRLPLCLDAFGHSPALLEKFTT
jgi:signal transduction histidine kinase